MTINEQKGNMYEWVTHTWNPIKGKCPHQCSYCYMKEFAVGELRLDEKALNDNLGEGNVIFVGSSTDMWAEEVPEDWIRKVLLIIGYSSDKNTYLFQTKNPKRFTQFWNMLPENRILGTTVETNYNGKDYIFSKAPDVVERLNVMCAINGRKMISIEPIIDCDGGLLEWIRDIKPEFVSIGADSKGHNLPEPNYETIQYLITELEKFTEVKLKDNLKRLNSKKYEAIK